MSVFFDVLIILLLFGLFGTVHSLLASVKLKQKIIDAAGSKIALYRLFYNLTSFLIFIIIYDISPKPDLTIYDLNPPFDLIILAFQFISLIGLLWTARYIDLKEFLGISQLFRYMKNEYDVKDMDEHQVLITKGPFKLCRHPVYFFSILLIGLTPTMDLFYLVMFISLTIYFFIGAYFEEKKLAARFGESYLDYQNKVPRILPFKLM